jgi:hypothetical protein
MFFMFGEYIGEFGRPDVMIIRIATPLDVIF